MIAAGRPWNWGIHLGQAQRPQKEWCPTKAFGDLWRPRLLHGLFAHPNLFPGLGLTHTNLSKA